MDKIKNGERIILLANKTEGWNEATGKVLEYDVGHDIYTVQVDQSYRLGEDDDGLREIASDGIRKETDHG